LLAREVFSFDVTPSATGWFDVDLTAYDIAVSGDFYIAIEYETAFQPGIGFDASGSPAGRSYGGSSGSWTLLQD